MISAVSAPRPSGANRVISAPPRLSRTVTVSPRTAANVAGPEPSRLPVTTTLSMSGGTAASENSSDEGGVNRTPGPLGWL